VYIDTGSSAPNIPSKSRGLAEKITFFWRNGNDSKQAYYQEINSLTANNSNPTIATMETGASFPRKSVKSPTEFIAAKRRAFPTTIIKARFAEVQNPLPVMAEMIKKNGN